MNTPRLPRWSPVPSGLRKLRTAALGTAAFTLLAALPATFAANETFDMVMNDYDYTPDHMS